MANENEDRSYDVQKDIEQEGGRKQYLPTPQTLDEAIEQAISTIDGHNAKEHIYKTIVDFMAQKFSVAYVNADKRPLELFILQRLYEKLTLRIKQ